MWHVCCNLASISTGYKIKFVQYYGIERPLASIPYVWFWELKDNAQSEHD